MKLQLVGAISGTSDYKARFAESAQRWRARGCAVVDPCEFFAFACEPCHPMDCPICGICEGDRDDHTDMHEFFPACPTHEEALMACIHSLTDGTVQGIVRLAGWEHSAGAKLENQVAMDCGLEVLDDAG